MCLKSWRDINPLHPTCRAENKLLVTVTSLLQLKLIQLCVPKSMKNSTDPCVVLKELSLQMKYIVIKD